METVMKTLTTLRSAAVATFAVAALSVPTIAQANDYNNCSAQSQEEQLVAGLIGAVLGGVAGSQLAGNGARSEGSALGAIAGGIAGAAIADGNNDCDKRQNPSYNNRNYSGQTYGTRTVYQPTRTRGYNNGYRTTGYSDRGYRRSDNRGYNRRGYDNRGYNNRRGYDNRSHNGYNNGNGSGLRAQLEDVRYRLYDLRDQNRRIERHLRRDHHNYRLLRRQERVCDEILRLEKKERRIKRKLNRQANYRY